MKTYETRIPGIGETTWEEGGQAVAPSPEGAALLVVQGLEDSGDLSAMTSRSELAVLVREVGVIRPRAQGVDLEREAGQWAIRCE